MFKDFWFLAFVVHIDDETSIHLNYGRALRRYKQVRYHCEGKTLHGLHISEGWQRISFYAGFASDRRT